MDAASKIVPSGIVPYRSESPLNESNDNENGTHG
jgi:hypothetical protein